MGLSRFEHGITQSVDSSQLKKKKSMLLHLPTPGMGLEVQCQGSSYNDMIISKDAQLNLTSLKNSSWEDTMLMGGDYDLNSSQVSGNSVKENLRQIMLNQEVVFRKQVNELHRLYTTQKTLMKECSWRELNGYKLGNASTQSTVRSSSDQLRCDPLATEKAYSTIFMVGSTHSVGNNSSGLQQNYLDLQLPSVNCMNYTGRDLLVMGSQFDLLGKSNESNHYFRNDDVYCPEEVKLSLSIGGGSTKKGFAGEPLNEKISRAPSQDIIEIEESAEMVSNDDSESVVCGTRITSGHKHDSQVPAQSDQNLTESLVKDPFHAFIITDSFIVGNGISEERNSSNEGLDECYDDVPRDNVFAKGKLFNSSVPPIDLDLNMIQLDESSFYSNDSAPSFPLVASSSGLGDAVPGLRASNSNDNSNYVSAISPKFKEGNGNNTCIIDLELMSELRSDLSEERGNHSRNMDPRLNIQKGNHKHTARPAVNCGKMNEDIDPAHPCSSQSANGDAHCSRCPTPTACTFDCIADDNPNNTRTMLSGTDLGGSSLSPSSMIQNFESPQVAEATCQPDSGSSGSSEMKHQFCVEKKGKSAEIDILVQKAALSLVCISLENPVSNYNVETAISGSNEVGASEREQPECSTDSYEAMVLNLTELSTDDYCISSNPFEVNEMDKKEGGIKLRRGRRLKDFQKDILPGLASLSRHEICEDINIMEGVMRSREYKRLRSKTANKEKWFTPVRSRRSRVIYVGRSYYS